MRNWGSSEPGPLFVAAAESRCLIRNSPEMDHWSRFRLDAVICRHLPAPLVGTDKVPRINARDVKDPKAQTYSAASA